MLTSKNRYPSLKYDIEWGTDGSQMLTDSAATTLYVMVDDYLQTITPVTSVEIGLSLTPPTAQYFEPTRFLEY